MILRVRNRHIGIRRRGSTSQGYEETSYGGTSKGRRHKVNMKLRTQKWIPACAGMTKNSVNPC
ncbi:MAG: hypothetical protein WCW64_08535 [Phycisphaerae bacterium]